mgnify:CR=1 FL=1
MDKIAVEVAYALPDQQLILEVEVDEGSTVEQAINESGILDHFPQIDLSASKVGIFGKITKLANPVRARDRVEIYRPLIADPKEVRKKRAAEGKKMKRGGGDAEG